MSPVRSSVSSRLLATLALALALVLAPTSIGRGTLLSWLEGACTPGCECDDAETAAEPSAAHDEHVLHADEECPPDCGDCHCSASAVQAVLDVPHIAGGALDVLHLDWPTLPVTAGLGMAPRPFRPPNPTRPGAARDLG